MSNLYKSILHRGYNIEIYHDETPENPVKGWNMFGSFACYDSKHDLSCEKGRELAYSFTNIDSRYIEYFKANEAYYLPLYLYEHSGLTISTNPFPCQWDSGQIGYVFVTKAQALENFAVNEITSDIELRIYDLLRAEVAAYDHYLQGDVFYYVALNAEGKEIGTYSGFYGSDPEQIEYAKQAIDNDISDLISRQLHQLKNKIRHRVSLMRRYDFSHSHKRHLNN